MDIFRRTGNIYDFCKKDGRFLAAGKAFQRGDRGMLPLKKRILIYKYQKSNSNTGQ